MIHFHFYLFLALALYLIECLVPVPRGGWLFLSLFKRFSLTRGPALGFRNPYPLGFAYRFPPPHADPPLGKSLDWEEARNRWELFQQKAKVLHWFSSGMLGVAATAIMTYELRLGSWFLWFLFFCAFLYLHMALVQSFSSAHKELYPGQNNRRWKYLALCLFSPWQSSRAMDLLGEELFAEFHPFAVGKVLLEETERNLFFRRWLLELKYPADSPRGNAVSQLFPAKDREKELKKLTLWMAQAGLNYQASLPPPTPTQSSQKSYCPRCETAYTLGKGTCLDCGRDLIPF